MNSLKCVVAIAWLALVLAGAAVSVKADQAFGLEGQWEGAISLPGTELGVSIIFSQDESQQWQGSIDIPMQQAKDLPLANISLDGNKTVFGIEGIPGDPTFHGIISAGGDSLTGTFTQGGQSFPFALGIVDTDDLAEREAELEQKLELIRAFADSMLSAWNAPGLSLAIVKGGDVVLSEGFGYRHLVDSLPVDNQTLFAIGSSTKAFTATIMGTLADSGLLKWDEPIRTYMPEFRLYDDVASERMTTTDLLCHRSGLPRHDGMWYFASFSRPELIGRLQYLEPNKQFREAWQYQNLMFATAGYLAEQITGQTWEELVKERIFTPLQMTRSNLSVSVSQSDGNHARPYMVEEDTLKEIPFRNIDAVGPAGSINSTSDDMANWLLMQLNRGEFEGTRVISEGMLAKTHTSHMAMGSPNQYDELLNTSYGLGWFIQTYRGHHMVQHGGNIDGFSAMVQLLPRDDIGVVVLTNQNGSAIPNILAFYAADLMLDLEPIDWQARFSGKDGSEDEDEKDEDDDPRQEPEPVKGTRLSHKLEAYTGTFAHPGYGEVVIEKDGKTLTASMGTESAELEHWHYDVFAIRVEMMRDTRIFLTFHTNARGDIDRFEIPLEPSVSPIVFERQPDASMSDPEFLARLAGKYDISGTVIEFSLTGNQLTATVPGQAPYTLVPYREREFKLEGYEGYSVEFVFDDEKVMEAIFHQPNGDFSAKRVE